MINHARCPLMRSVVVFAAIICTAQVVNSRPPNIVFILADDYGFHDIGYHGAEFKTKNLDDLAAKGVKLENYYVQPICSPTRSQLMTGRYQIHTGLQHNIIWPSQPYGVPLNDSTIADVLRQQGYSTHAIGKWHLGLFKKEYTPLHRGFDTFYGYWEGGEDYYTYFNCDGFHNHTEDDINEEDIFLQGYSEDRIRSMAGRTEKERFCGYDLRDMETPVTDMNHTYSTLLYTRKAIDVIDKAAKSDKPFFMYLAYQAVHSPMEAPKKYIEPYSKIKNKYRRIYAGMVSAMDDGIGNVTQALRKSGLWNNTVIIFSTDNGGQVHAGGNNSPLRGLKHTLWEGGVRGIGFVTGPLVEQRSGTVSEEMIHVSDWFPTMADIAGAKLNASLKLDGLSQWDMISQGKPSRRKEILHNIDILHPLRGKMKHNDTFDTRVRAAVRIGHYKLLTGDPGDGRWYPVPSADGELPSVDSRENSQKNVWLFNVKKDPEEKHDLSEQMPHKVKELLARIAAYNATAVPPQYPPSDPRCDPRKHGMFWGPWE